MKSALGKIKVRRRRWENAKQPHLDVNNPEFFLWLHERMDLTKVGKMRPPAKTIVRYKTTIISCSIPGKEGIACHSIQSQLPLHVPLIPMAEISDGSTNRCACCGANFELSDNGKPMLYRRRPSQVTWDPVYSNSDCNTTSS